MDKEKIEQKIKHNIKETVYVEFKPDRGKILLDGYLSVKELRMIAKIIEDSLHEEK